MQIRPLMMCRSGFGILLSQICSVRCLIPVALVLALISFHQVFVTVGMGTRASGCLLIIVMAGLFAGMHCRRRMHRLSACLMMLSLVAWTLSRGLITLGIQSLFLGVIPGSIVEWMYPLLLALLVSGPAVFTVGRLLSQMPYHGFRIGPSMFLSGICLWLILCIGAGQFSHQSVCWGSGFIMLAALMVEWRRVQTSDKLLNCDSHPAESTKSVTVFARGADSPRWLTACGFALWFLAGICLTGAWEMLRQFFPVVMFSVFSGMAGVIGGLGFGLWLSHRIAIGTSRNLAVGLAVVICGMTALSSEMIHGQLWANAHVSSEFLMLLWRSSFIACVMALPTICCTLAAHSKEVEEQSSTLDPWHPVCLGFGFTTGVGLLGTHLGPTILTLVFPVAVTVSCLVVFLALSESVTTWRRSAFAGALVVLLAGLCYRAETGYRPQQAARLLFSTGVFEARFTGQPVASLEFLDEGRLIERQRGSHGDLTVWKYRGTQLQVREAGIPKSILSTNSLICPDYSAEILPALLPLVLHQDPAEVLLIGAGGGTALSTILTFPVRNVAVLESQPEVIELLERHVWPHEPIPPTDDGRVKLVVRNPLIELRRGAADQDVIVVGSDDPVLAHSAGYWTREFYEACSRRLKSGGLFCQRFKQVDFGIEPMRLLISTIRNVFPDTIAFETAPGELVVIGANEARETDGILSGDPVARIQRRHTRQVLARVGWDWVRLLSLPLYDRKGVAALTDSGPVRINRDVNGLMSGQLPVEMMRWGEKMREREEVLAAHRSNLLAQLPVEHGDLTEIRYRLNELKSLSNLMVNYPDEPWSYRRKLRDMMQQQPRTSTRQVSNDEEEISRHPVDRRRMQYLKALSLASRERSVNSIRNLATFNFPFDPMLSHFVHFEVAELYARSEPTDPRAELIHRLHCIYFAHPADRSVRDVVKAIHLLVEKPASEPDTQQQWDHLNSLLQVMFQRWKLRRGTPPDSVEIALNDVDKALRAISLATDRMTELCGPLDVPPSDWEARENHLQRNLVRPLRTYRTDLLPHYKKQIYTRSRSDRANRSSLAN